MKIHLKRVSYLGDIALVKPVEVLTTYLFLKMLSLG